MHSLSIETFYSDTKLILLFPRQAHLETAIQISESNQHVLRGKDN